jgi:mannosyltransferase OCH1-like enzyme
MDIKEYIYNYYKLHYQLDNNYTYKQAIIDVKQKIYEKESKKILFFNKDIIYEYDLNNIPKIIHFTLKDKNNITNDVWKNCLFEYRRIYPDYKIILYDDTDIFNIIQYFDKKNIDIVKNIQQGAILADVFRYLILYLRGGYYSDMDCFPHKRIEELSNNQYHGDIENNIYLCNQNFSLDKKAYEFYENPCNNCRLILNNSKHTHKVKQIYKCLGHKYVNNETNIIVGYEFEKTWHNDLINSNKKLLWTDNNIGICQWFIGTKPREKLFKKCYNKSLENIKNTNFNDKNNFHFNVINSTGPLFFTKIINKFLNNDSNFKNKIAILPCDFFCCGSAGGSSVTVPSTKNMFIQHKFTGTWLK